MFYQTFNSNNFNLFVVIFILLAGFLSVGFNVIVRKLAIRYDITDKPASNPNRKLQKKPVPLLGGVGIGLSVVVCIVLLWWLQSSGLNPSLFQSKFDQTGLSINFGYLILAIMVILMGGFLDDKFNLSAKWMIVPINLAIGIVVFLGDIKIQALSYPFDTLLPQNPIIGYLLAYLWIGFCLASTKFLDGLDGLVSSVGVVSFLVIASISLFGNVGQPLVFLLAVICGIATAGFLPFNFPNAKSYLGESGSEIVGFLVGVLSVVSGAKVATAGLVMGWFILDIVLVMLARVLQKKSPFAGGREHWHFRLQDIGLSKLQVLVLTTIILLISSSLALVLPTDQKLYALGFQILVLPVMFLIWFLGSQKIIKK